MAEINSALEVKADKRGGAIYCALFLVSWAFCWSSFSLRSFQGDQLDRQLIDLPGDLERRLVVVVVHARAGIHPDIEGLVDRLKERNGVRDRLTDNFLVIHRQYAGAAFTETGTVILEVKHDGVLAWSECR